MILALDHVYGQTIGCKYDHSWHSMGKKVTVRSSHSDFSSKQRGRYQNRLCLRFARKSEIPSAATIAYLSNSSATGQLDVAIIPRTVPNTNLEIGVLRMGATIASAPHIAAKYANMCMSDMLLILS